MKHRFPGDIKNYAVYYKGEQPTMFAAVHSTCSNVAMMNLGEGPLDAEKDIASYNIPDSVCV